MHAPSFITNLQIFYENRVHNKFSADLYAIIPKGIKTVLWFTNSKCICFKIAKRPSTSNQHDLVSYEKGYFIPIPFSNKDIYNDNGTVLYGTIVFEKDSTTFKRFSVENIYYFCGIKQEPNGNLMRYKQFFEYYSKYGIETQIQLFIPIMHTKYEHAMNELKQVKSYTVFSIQHRFLNKNPTEFKNILINSCDQAITNVTVTPKKTLSANVAFKLPTQSKIFSQNFYLRADTQNDIYHILNNPEEPITNKTMIAHIPNYTTSVMMNSLFRNIKENKNLDALEESDDECEESTKLVDLDKCLQMKCSFNSRFKRWQPLALVSEIE